MISAHSRSPLVLLMCHTCFVRYAESVGAAHIYTSAKLNKGLDETFVELSTSKIPYTHPYKRRTVDYACLVYLYSRIYTPPSPLIYLIYTHILIGMVARRAASSGSSLGALTPGSRKPQGNTLTFVEDNVAVAPSKTKSGSCC